MPAFRIFQQNVTLERDDQWFLPQLSVVFNAVVDRCMEHNLRMAVEETVSLNKNLNHCQIQCCSLERYLLKFMHNFK